MPALGALSSDFREGGKRPGIYAIINGIFKLLLPGSARVPETGQTYKLNATALIAKNSLVPRKGYYRVSDPFIRSNCG